MLKMIKMIFRRKYMSKFIVLTTEFLADDQATTESLKNNLKVFIGVNKLVDTLR